MTILLILREPMFFLAFFAFIILIVNALEKNPNISYFLSILSLIYVGITSVNKLFYTIDIAQPEFISNMLVFNHTSNIFDLIFILGGLLTVILSKRHFAKTYEYFGELNTLTIFSIVGMMLIAHSQNLILLFIGIEIMSISFYILTAIIRTNTYCIEAGIKYFVMGVFASGFLLLGISFLYGSTGSMQLNSIGFENINSTYFFIGLTFFFIGLLFKAAIIPFHQWAPDVYTGAPTVITAFMSTAGKAGAIAALIALSKYLVGIIELNIIIANKAPILQLTLAIIAAITMIVGNIIALVQKDIKRMLAYSSIAHAGYILMGIVVMDITGIDAAVYYSLVYLLMQFGALLFVMLLETKENPFIELSDILGLAKKMPILALLISVFMFALVGIPPFGGFMGKLLLFKAAIDNGMLWLTICAIIGSIISVFYYINIVKKMYFEDAKENVNAFDMTPNKPLMYAMAICAILALGLGLFPSLIF